MISPCLVEAGGLGRGVSSKKRRPRGGGEAIRQDTEQTEEAALRLFFRSSLFGEHKCREKRVSWWLKPVVPVPKNLRQEDRYEFSRPAYATE